MPYNKSFIDQASLVKMAGYWPSSLFAFLWTETIIYTCNYQWRGDKSVLFTSATYTGQDAAGRGKGFK